MDGFFVIDKPVGMTSHDVVNLVRRTVGQKKAGHTGTLDPFASGVLPVALGEGTKAIPFLDESVKEYEAVMVLGVATDTQDCDGTVTRVAGLDAVSVADVENVCRSFTGQLLQVPPMFSALKRNGVPLYRLARKGEVVEREPRGIEIFALTVTRIELPEVAFTVRCSRGTYVRTLASDIGESLGCGAHLVKLRRTMSGTFSIAQAISADELRELGRDGALEQRIISPYAALAHMRGVDLDEESAAKVSCGIAPALDRMTGAAVDPEAVSPERIRLSVRGRLCAVAEIAPARLLRVFNTGIVFT